MQYNYRNDSGRMMGAFVPDNAEALLSRLESAGKVPSKDKFRCMVCWTMIATGNCPYNDRCVFLHDPRIKHAWLRLKAMKPMKVAQTQKDTFYWPDMQRTALQCRQGLPDVNQAYVIPKFFAISAEPQNHPAYQHKLIKSSVSLGIYGNGGSSNGGSGNNGNITLFTRSYFHDRAMYSIWAHFVTYCDQITREEAVNNQDFNTIMNNGHLSVSSSGLCCSFGESQYSIYQPFADDAFAERNVHIPSMRRLPVFVDLATKTELESKKCFNLVTPPAVALLSNNEQCFANFHSSQTLTEYNFDESLMFQADWLYSAVSAPGDDKADLFIPLS